MTPPQGPTGPRILLVADDYDKQRGGIEYHARSLRTSLARIGCAVEFVDFETRFPLLEAAEYSWILIDGIDRRRLGRVAKFAADEVRVGVFTHGSFYEFVHWKELWKDGLRSSGVTRIAKFVVDRTVCRRWYHRVDVFYTLASRESSEVSHYLSLPACRFEVSGNYIGSEPGEDSQVMVTQRSLSMPYVCSVGRVERRKNHLSVLKAIDGLPVHYYLAGKDAGALAEITRYARSRGITNFTYLGSVTDYEKARIIAGSAATVTPAYLEGVPYSVLESLALGVPAICTSRSYLPQFSGVIFSDPRPASLRAAIIHALSDPPRVFRDQLPRESDVVGRLLESLNSRERRQ